MPHDKKGRLIEVGDHLQFDVCESYDHAAAAWNKRPTIGRVISITPGSESCNVQAVHLAPGYWPLKQETITAKDTELVLKADGSEPAGAAVPQADGGFGRLGAMVAVALLAIAALAGSVVAADAPVVGPSPAPTFTWTPYSFTETAFTVGGNKRQIVGARFLGHLRLPYRLHLTARVDATATQDGGAVEVNAADPKTFSSLESYFALERELLGPLTALVVYGVTLPVESGHLEVLDRYPKTFGAGVGLHVSHSWLAFALAPRHDPAGSGLHVLIGGSIQVESHTFIVGDTALGHGSYWRGGVGIRLK